MQIGLLQGRNPICQRFTWHACRDIVLEFRREPFQTRESQVRRRPAQLVRELAAALHLAGLRGAHQLRHEGIALGLEHVRDLLQYGVAQGFPFRLEKVGAIQGALSVPA